MINQSLKGAVPSAKRWCSMSSRAANASRAVITSSRHGALMLLALALSACEPTLERRVLEYERQLNAGNVDGVLPLFADDATVRTAGMLPVTGREELRGMAEWDSVLHTRRIFYDMETEGDTVLANVIESNDWLAALGIQEMSHPTTLVVFRDGLIFRIEFETDTVASDALRRSLNAVLEWAVRERPHVVRILASEAGFHYNAANAAQWLHLLGEWRDTAAERP